VRKMRNTARCEDALSQTHLEHLLLETKTMRKLNEFSRPAISQHNCCHLDRSSYNSLMKQVVEFKIILHQLKRILEQSSEQNGNRETQLYEERIADLEKEINTKNQRIKRLEEILSSKRGRQTMRQCLSVRSGRGQSSPARSPCPSSDVMKPCNHVWGPCANDHTNHHARRGRGTSRHQFRSLSATSRL